MKKKITFLKWNVTFHSKVNFLVILIGSKRPIWTSGDLTLQSVYFYLINYVKIFPLKWFVFSTKSLQLGEWITPEPGQSESSDAPSRGSPTLSTQTDSQTFS
jgi:hypothetical protein